MVVAVVPVVNIDGVIGNNGIELRQIKIRYPNVSQLFHFRKSHSVRILANNKEDIELIRNEVLTAFGAQLPISPSDMKDVTREALEAALAPVLKEGESIVSDIPRPADWDFAHVMHGIRAATEQRRLELLTIALDLLKLERYDEPVKAAVPAIPTIRRDPCIAALPDTAPGFSLYALELQAQPKGRKASAAAARLSLHSAMPMAFHMKPQLILPTKYCPATGQFITAVVEPPVVVSWKLSTEHSPARRWFASWPEVMCTHLNSCIALRPQETLALTPPPPPTRPPPPSATPKDGSSSPTTRPTRPPPPPPVFELELTNVPSAARRESIKAAICECIHNVAVVHDLMLPLHQVKDLAVEHRVAVLSTHKFEDFVHVALLMGTKSNVAKWEAHAALLKVEHLQHQRPL